MGFHPHMGSCRFPGVALPSTSACSLCLSYLQLDWEMPKTPPHPITITCAGYPQGDGQTGRGPFAASRDSLKYGLRGMLAGIKPEPASGTV